MVLKNFKLKHIVTFFTLLCVFSACFVVTTPSVKAEYKDYNFSFSFDTKHGSSGDGFIDGSANGRFYKLTKGKASIVMTSFKYEKDDGEIVISIRKKGTGKSVGYVSVRNSDARGEVKILEDGMYYLYVSGSPFNQFSGSGVLHDHRIY